MGTVSFEVGAKWPEFVIQEFQKKRNGGGASSGYTESHLSSSQRWELPHVRLKFLTRDFKSSYATYVVNKEAAGSSGHP